MSKPWGDPSRGISSGDVLIRPERHPACRRREAQPGSCTERENLTGDAKGKGASGSNREAEGTDAPERGGLLRSSDEAGVMPVERRELLRCQRRPPSAPRVGLKSRKLHADAGDAEDRGAVVVDQPAREA